MPELSTTAELAKDVRRRDDRKSSLFVAGSFHATEATGRRVNVSEVSVGESVLLRHYKFRPMELPVREMLSAEQPHLVGLAGGGWCLGVCICRDFLDPDTAAVMAVMGVNLAVIPAMSESLEAFRGAVELLGTRTQAVVILVNGPREFVEPIPPDSASRGGGGEDHGASIAAQPDGLWVRRPIAGPVQQLSPEGIGATVIDLHSERVEWRPVSQGG